jgi:hypothetical protein
MLLRGFITWCRIGTQNPCSLPLIMTHYQYHQAFRARESRAISSAVGKTTWSRQSSPSLYFTRKLTVNKAPVRDQKGMASETRPYSSTQAGPYNSLQVQMVDIYRMFVGLCLSNMWSKCEPYEQTSSKLVLPKWSLNPSFAGELPTLVRSQRRWRVSGEVRPRVRRHPDGVSDTCNGQPLRLSSTDWVGIQWLRML